MAVKKCFVIMPFGDKTDFDGKDIDFDKIYKYLIKPPIESLGLECIRCDEIGKPGWIHAQMIKHIFHDDIAIVDISTLNPNVFFELGVRQALKSNITVLMRKKGTKVPFNIQGLKVIEYDSEDMESVEKTKEKIKEYINEGIRSNGNDSLVHEVLPLKIGSMPKVLKKTESFSYAIATNEEKKINIITGDVQKIKGIDIWVNSENTNMQMARFFDRSVSSVIRYLGAKKNAADLVIEDIIADDLTKIVGHNNTVPPATIIPTTPGELEISHQVKYIFHAASVSGAVGHGYSPIPNVADCITNALNKAESSDFGICRNILFPLMGTGTARGNLRSTVGPLIDAAIEHFRMNPEGRIRDIFFLVWSEEELMACQSVLDNSPMVVKSNKIAQQ